MLNKSDLFPIGIGTWGIGGFMERDSSVDEQRQTSAIAYMIDKGLNFVEANDWYSQGYSVEILANAIKQSGKSRDDLFICQAVYLKEGTLNDVEVEVDKVCSLLGTDHVDSLQFTSGVFQKHGYEQSVDTVQKILDKGKARYTSITNENLDLLKKYHQTFGDKLFSHEVCINLEVRANEKEGTPQYAKDNDILTVVYQPLRRNRTASRNWSVLVDIAAKYEVTQNQVILKWLASKGYLPLTKSENTAHIDEHIVALNIPLTQEDIAVLDTFTPPGYTEPKVDWDKSGDGVSIDQMSNVFDDEYDKQTGAKQ